MQHPLAAELAEAIVRAEQIGAAHLVPLLRAARAGVLNPLIVPRGTTAPMRRLKTSTKPALVLIGDDDDEPTGPAGWPQAVRLMRWCGVVVVHSTGAQVHHYKAAVDGALVCRRMLLVETNTATEPEWLALLRRLRPGLPGLIVRVRPGEAAHPRMTAPAGATIQ